LIEKNLLTIEILEALEKSAGCPLCYLWMNNEERHMEYLLTNEVLMDSEFKQKVVLARGFCNYHMHLLNQTTHRALDGLGYALYMKDIVESIMEQLRLLPLGSLSKPENESSINIQGWGEKRRHILQRLYKAVKHAVQGERSCPVYEFLRSLEIICLHTLLQMLDDEDFRKDCQSAKALCLPHFLSGVGMILSDKLRNWVEVARTPIEVENMGLQTAANYFSEFIRKQDWNTRSGPRGIDVNANTMALDDN
jgi:hypothetical protein